MRQALPDPYNLGRFIDAQQGVYPQVLKELRDSRKTTHWMWFIFPQIRGLGSSATAQHFAISGAAEASAYLDHPTLGTRLRECTGLVNAAPQHTSVEQIFGYPDHLKFHSSMTLFNAVAPEEPEFHRALDRFFAGQPDPNTLSRL